MKRILILLFIAGGALTAKAQTDQYKAAFMYRFASMVKWPGNMESGDFVIGVVGNSPVKEGLEKLAASKTVGGRKIVIKTFSGADAVGKAQMLFVPDGSKSKLGEIAAATDKGTLIITESTGLVSKGSAINFLVSGGKLKFELSTSAIEKAGLKTSGELNALAILVD